MPKYQNMAEESKNEYLKELNRIAPIVILRQHGVIFGVRKWQRDFHIVVYPEIRGFQQVVLRDVRIYNAGHQRFGTRASIRFVAVNNNVVVVIDERIMENLQPFSIRVNLGLWALA